MKIKQLIDDHGLDARMYDQQYAWGTCPVCFSGGKLMIDTDADTYQCHACKSSGNAAKLDALLRKVRPDKRLR